MREEQLHPYLQLRANFLEVRRAWKSAALNADQLPDAKPFVVDYYKDVNSILHLYLRDSLFLVKNVEEEGLSEEEALIQMLENFSFFKPSKGYVPATENEVVLTELSKLTLDRLYRVSRRFLRLENESYQEEDMIFHDEEMVGAWLYRLFGQLHEYLTFVSPEVKINEGRIELESVLHFINQLQPNLTAVTFRDEEFDQTMDQIILDYFDSYAFCLRMKRELNWEFLTVVCQRVKLVAEKATNDFNRVLISMHMRQLSAALGQFLGKTPEAPMSGSTRPFNAEKKCYQMMVNSLFYIQKSRKKGLAEAH